MGRRGVRSRAQRVAGMDTNVRRGTPPSGPPALSVALSRATVGVVGSALSVTNERPTLLVDPLILFDWGDRVTIDGTQALRTASSTTARDMPRYRHVSGDPYGVWDRALNGRRVFNVQAGSGTANNAIDYLEPVACEFVHACKFNATPTTAQHLFAFADNNYSQINLRPDPLDGNIVKPVFLFYPNDPALDGGTQDYYMIETDFAVDDQFHVWSLETTDEGLTLFCDAVEVPWVAWTDYSTNTRTLGLPPWWGDVQWISYTDPLFYVYNGDDGGGWDGYFDMSGVTNNPNAEAATGIWPMLSAPQRANMVDWLRWPFTPLLSDVDGLDTTNDIPDVLPPDFDQGDLLTLDWLEYWDTDNTPPTYVLGAMTEWVGLHGTAIEHQPGDFDDVAGPTVPGGQPSLRVMGRPRADPLPQPTGTAQSVHFVARIANSNHTIFDEGTFASTGWVSDGVARATTVDAQLPAIGNAWHVVSFTWDAAAAAAILRVDEQDPLVVTSFTDRPWPLLRLFESNDFAMLGFRDARESSNDQALIHAALLAKYGLPITANPVVDASDLTAIPWVDFVDFDLSFPSNNGGFYDDDAVTQIGGHNLGPSGSMPVYDNTVFTPGGKQCVHLADGTNDGFQTGAQYDFGADAAAAYYTVFRFRQWSSASTIKFHRLYAPDNFNAAQLTIESGILTFDPPGEASPFLLGTPAFGDGDWLAVGMTWDATRNRVAVNINGVRYESDSWNPLHPGRIPASIAITSFVAWVVGGTDHDMDVQSAYWRAGWDEPNLDAVVAQMMAENGIT